MNYAYNIMIEKYKEVEQNPIIPELPTVETDPRKLQSPNYDEYSQKMSEYGKAAQTAYIKMQNNKHGQQWITYRSYFTNKLELNIQEQSINRQIVFLNAQWGHFSMRIKILNIRGSNTKHVYELDRGAYGSIYKGKFNRENFIIKCLPLQYKDSRLRAIKQWFLMKLASIAGAGPHLQPYFGFDIIMFEECIQFAMEECEQVSVHNSKMHHFYENLAILHKLHVVHQDIKPNNIMYSPFYDKAVFIDFGLSKIIPQKIGKTTLTNFVGTMDYWSPEMGKCYMEKKPRMVDLYYNDLFGLEKTIEDLKKSQSTVLDAEADIYSGVIIPNFEYLGLIIWKYFIYRNKFDQFNSRYLMELKKIQKDTLNFYQAQILQFFEQLSPTKGVKKFFQKFFSQKHKQTPLYSKLSVLYQVSQKNLCSLRLFRNQQKFIYFSNMCKQFSVESNQETLHKSQKQNLTDFLTNKDLIKQTPFIKYLGLYLEYTCYFSDKYDVSNNNRLTAAKIYYQIFIKKQKTDSSELQGCFLMIQTIKHALKWCLNQQQISQYSSQLPYLLFKIYDFLIILDIGSSEQFFKWIDKIYEHKSFNKTIKKIFVLRVKQSNNLNLIRLNHKQNTSRYHFVLNVNDWASNKLLSDHFSEEISCLQQKSLNQQFYQNYGLETIKHNLMINKQLKKANQFEFQFRLIGMYYEILKNNTSHKLMYFLPILYRNSPAYRDLNFCKQIQEIFRLCIRDQSIMSQFSFYLENQLILNKILSNQNPQTIISNLKSINQYLKNVNTADLCLFVTSIQKTYGLIQLLQCQKKYDLGFLYEKDGYVVRVFQSELQSNVNFLKNKNIGHICNQLTRLQPLLFYSQNLSQEAYRQVKLILQDEQMIAGKICQKCKNIKQLILRSGQLHYIYKKYFKLKIRSKSDSHQQSQIISRFSRVYDSECLNFKDRDNFDDKQCILIEKNLYYGLLICQHLSDQHMRRSGIMNYYNFVQKQNKMKMFLYRSALGFRLRNIFSLLKLESIESLAGCLYKFSQELAQSLIIEWYYKIRDQLYSLFRIMTYQQFSRLFYSLQQIFYLSSPKSQQHPYVIMIYNCILMYVKSCSLLYKKIIATILKNISKLHLRFKKMIQITIFAKMSISEAIKKNRRKRLSYNNKLVKLLMVQGQTVLRKNIKSSRSAIKMCLNSKIFKIGEYQRVHPNLKYMKKSDSFYRQSF